MSAVTLLKSQIATSTPVCCTHPCKEKSIYEVFQARVGQVIAYKHGVAFYLKKVDLLPAKRAGGTSEQAKATLVSQDGRHNSVRIKTSNVNEAVINHQITAERDPLSFCLPKFYGAYNADGERIDARTLASRTLKPQKLYIILDDVATQESATVNDYKFCRTEILLRNHKERVKHEPETLLAILTTLVYKVFKYYVVKFFSGFSFALSAKAGWFGTIRSWYSYWHTTTVLKSHFEKLNKDELENTIEELTQMKTMLSLSRFAFSDASLLAVSFRRDGVQKIKFHFIDMSYGMRADEGIDNFAEVKRDLLASMDDLIAFAKKLQSK